MAMFDTLASTKKFSMSRYCTYSSSNNKILNQFRKFPSCNELISSMFVQLFFQLSNSHPAVSLTLLSYIPTLLSLCILALFVKWKSLAGSRIIYNFLCKRLLECSVIFKWLFLYICIQYIECEYHGINKVE